MTVGVVHGHGLTRAGMVEVLRAQDDLTVVGQGRDGADAIRMARDTQPDALVLDVSAAGMCSVVAELLDARPELGVVAVSAGMTSELLLKLLQLGISSYLDRSLDSAELAVAVRRSARRDSLPPDDDTVLVALPRPTLAAMLTSATGRNLLSDRELQVLRRLDNAESNRQMAESIGISEGTVKRHLCNIYAKLGASTRLDAVRLGRAAGLLA